ncbi:DUF6174 domain-containing protein [Streptomyces scabiei]|uniref:DUF6174 domain-containing protein n=1 Tax=Streptomyces TaxID=1883 RepID=UPI001C257EA7|nr:DUF6174 domain-containing protein [Streptomyces sp. AC495_CC817]
MPTTTAVRPRLRALATSALAGTLLWAITGCGQEPTLPKASAPTWQEPASYTYTLRSTQGKRPLIGTFEVTVRDGKVVEAVGLDDSGRHVVDRSPQHVPTIGALLREAEAARAEGADTVDVTHAADGRPVSIAIDWEENAIDDEAAYDLSGYEALG